MDWLSYAFNFIPWWVWFVAILVALGLTVQFWAPIWAVLPKPVKIGLAAIGAIAAAYVAGRNRGSKDERNMQRDREANAIARRAEVDREVSNQTADETAAKLNRWNRD